MPPTDTHMPRSPANRDHRITRADPVGRIAPPDHARRHALGALAALGGITALPGASRAQTGVAGGYPSRAVRIIIPFSAGGTTDTTPFVLICSIVAADSESRNTATSSIRPVK